MTYWDERAAWERHYWTRLVARCKGNIALAARESGCNRPAVYRIFQRLNLTLVSKPRRGGNAVWHSLKDR